MSLNFTLAISFSFREIDFRLSLKSKVNTANILMRIVHLWLWTRCLNDIWYLFILYMYTYKKDTACFVRAAIIYVLEIKILNRKWTDRPVFMWRIIITGYTYILYAVCTYYYLRYLCILRLIFTGVCMCVHFHTHL